MKNEFEFLAAVVYIIALPLAIKNGLVAKKYRFHILTLSSIIIMISISWKIKFDGWDMYVYPQTFIPIIILGILGCFTLLLYVQKEKIPGEEFKLDKIVKYIIFGSIFQEIIFQYYLLNLSQSVIKEWYISYLLIIFLFVWMHIFYIKQKKLIAICFIGGVIYTSTYILYHNIWGNIVLHISFNSVALKYFFRTKIEAT